MRFGEALWVCLSFAAESIAGYIGGFNVRLQHLHINLSL